jgi:hypothetical protein
LRSAAKAFRAFHAGLAVVGLSALGYISTCGLTGRRGRFLSAAIAALVVEAGALVGGRGNCPLGPSQAKLGDPIPLFELALPPSGKGRRSGSDRGLGRRNRARCCPHQSGANATSVAPNAG